MQNLEANYGPEGGVALGTGREISSNKLISRFAWNPASSLESRPLNSRSQMSMNSSSSSVIFTRTQLYATWQK